MGHVLIAGLDEVGRGALAGPVVCGCVVFQILNQKHFKKIIKNEEIRIDDSKKLTSSQREKAAKWIKLNALGWGIGISSVAEINRKGISKSTASGFRRAVYKTESKLNSRITYLLIDAFYVPYIRGIRIPRKLSSKGINNKKRSLKSGNQLAIINGDEKSYSIAAASIIAKVYRDELMVRIGNKGNLKRFDWMNNKGYGTKKHKVALLKHGSTRLHRKIFVKTFLEKNIKEDNARTNKIFKEK